MSKQFDQNPQLADATCPWCSARSTGATAVEGESQPGVSDVSVCLYCVNVSVYEQHGDGLQLRRANKEDFARMDGAQLINIARAQAVIEQAMSRRRRAQERSK